MNVKRKPDIIPENMGKNPFIVNEMIKARSFQKDKHFIMQTNDGVNYVSGDLKESMLVEEQSCTKLYHDTDYRNIILKLDSKALRLFMFIMYQINPNEDYIWINNTLYQNQSSSTKSEYLEGLNYLIRYSIITTTIYPEVYFINPMIFFSGNRLKKYPDNIKVR
jgi:hypothetical protein